MECNKDEAIKAKGIAEKKMKIQDFEGARKTVLKAQRLFPDLDNISQMLTICNVHCSAQSKVVGSEMNWYGILQVELTADEVSIKKQYRKLALLLHPDKNNLVGAEAAFKLIGEAHRVLSDRLYRSAYDMKCKTLKERMKLPQEWQNSNLPAKKQPGMDNKFASYVGPKFTSFNLHQEQNRVGPDQSTFWTACSHCGIRYQYYIDILHKSLRCQKCMQTYVAYELNVQGVPQGANCMQPGVAQQRYASQNVRKMGSQTTVQDCTSNGGDQGHCDLKKAAVETFPNKTGTTHVIGRSKIDAEKDRGVNAEDKRQNQNKPKFAGRKRKKSEEESNKSCGIESKNNSDGFRNPEGIEDGVPVVQTSGTCEERNTQRPVQEKLQAASIDNSDDDFVRPPKDKSPPNVTNDQSDLSLNKEASKSAKPGVFYADNELKEHQESAPSEASSRNGNGKADPCKENRKEAPTAEGSKENLNSDHLMESYPSYKTKPDPEFIEVADAEFYVFDNDRKGNCFKNDQIWAIYDNMDGMPRFYARIRKVFSPGFKVKITWLEANPDDEDEINWVSEDLPVSCGRFKHGDSEDTEDINMFCQSVTYAKSARRGVIVIHPRKGEIWALFKNWDIKWTSDPDNHRNYEFDYVEVLSDYNEGSGIIVAYLEKEKGFVSLYSPKKGVDSYHIPPKERYRFSHIVPSYKTTGYERCDVPEGSFELDPASVPGEHVDSQNL
ncbi:Dnaj subfamily b member [Thalictrum thalictroides]|uniref:Dnaj subfamily b member n=1 Tax=Thalictrum thalictroides TaxID=46969 RepID=A0A7J6X404_THATH|nr:Dnaj subfamily b member [Thalictrum thalictroides]